MLSFNFRSTHPRAAAERVRRALPQLPETPVLPELARRRDQAGDRDEEPWRPVAAQKSSRREAAAVGDALRYAMRLPDLHDNLQPSSR